MESSFPNGGFEEFLQGKADQYKLYPSDRVWENINARLHPRTNWSYLFVAALFLGLGIGGKLSDSRFAREPQLAYRAENAASLITPPESPTPVVPISSRTVKAGTRLAGRSVDQPAVVIPLFPVAEERTVAEKRTGMEGSAVTMAKAAFDPVEETDITAELVLANIGQIDITTVETALSHPAKANRGNAIAPTEKSTAVAMAVAAGSGIPSEFKTIGINDVHAPGHKGEAVRSATEAAGADVVEDHAEANDEVAETSARGRANKPASINMPLTRKNSVGSLSAGVLDAPSSIKVLKPKRLNTSWQLYFGPSVSYRRLKGDGIRYYNAILGYTYSPDVNKSVTHKPDIGFEVGGALTFGVSRTVRFKTGIQVNVNQYDIMAYHSTPEIAPLSQGLGHSSISAVSRYRNFNGFSRTWLKNQHIMLSLPIGAEVVLFGNNRVQFQVAGTLQPTYVLNNQAYMISTNMKNYAQEPSLYNRLNLAAGAEAYFTIKAGSYKWMIGPQVRYQLFSSYKQVYPVTEHLTDYGFKIGIMK